MQPLLSPTEMAALMSTVSAPASSVAPSQVRSIDLVAREHQAHDRLAELQQAAQELSSDVGRVCARLLRAPCDCSADAVEVVPATQLVQMLGTPRLTYGLRTRGDVAGLVGIDAVLASAFVARRFGGGVETIAIGDAPPSPTERQAVLHLATEIVAAAERALAAVCPALSFAVSPNAGVLPAGVATLLITLRLGINDYRSTISCALVTSLIGLRATSPVVAPLPIQPPLLPALLSSAVCLTSTLGRCELPVRRFLGLRPGDLLVLDTPVDAPVAVLVEGRPKFRARPQLKAGALSLEVCMPTLATEKE